MVFSDLCFGTFDGEALRNDLGDRLSSNSMSQRKGRTVSRGVLLSAVAVGLATLTEPRGQKTGAQVIDAGQTRDELITFISECLQGNGHGSLLSDRYYKLSEQKRKPQPTLSDFAGDFYVVRPKERQIYNSSGENEYAEFLWANAFRKRCSPWTGARVRFCCTVARSLAGTGTESTCTRHRVRRASR